MDGCLSPPPTAFGRRAVLGGAATAALLHAAPAWARTPGSSDVNEAVEQIRDAAVELRRLQRDWATYAVIDAEGRAGNIDAARRILGGVAPQRGEAAIEVARRTPLYRIDGAFNAVREAAIDAGAGAWPAALDLDVFDEAGERILFSLQKTDGDFYGVVFASKGSSMLTGIYKEAKGQVDRSADDFDLILRLLREAGAPGL
jgi:hypothetical protein